MKNRLQKFFNKCVLISICFTLSISFLVSAAEHSKDQLKIMLITQREANDTFWSVVEDIASAAAKNLSIDFYLRHAQSDNNNMLRFVNEASDRGIDAIIFPNFKGVATKFLKLAEKRKIYTFLFNAGINDKNAERIGKPREKYKYWLGYSLPDDEHAGYLLAKKLIEKAKEKNLRDTRGHFQVVGITGIYANFPSMIRVQGLERAVNEYPDVDLNQVVYSEWKYEIAKKQMTVLSHRYPNASVFWGASDLISLGISDGAKLLTKQPNDFVTGGVDWSLPGLTAVEDNKITTSVGGHIFEAGWVVVMLYDFLNGVDFKKYLNQHHLQNYSSAVDVVLPMSTIDKAKVSQLKKRIKNKNWDDINFKDFSIYHHPLRKYYEFSNPEFLSELF